MNHSSQRRKSGTFLKNLTCLFHMYVLKDSPLGMIKYMHCLSKHKIVECIFIYNRTEWQWVSVLYR